MGAAGNSGIETQDTLAGSGNETTKKRSNFPCLRENFQ